MHHSDHSPCVVALGAFFSSFLVLPLGASSYARASSRSGESGTSRSDASRARRERTGRRPKPTRREHNASRNYRQLHTGETPDPLCPCAVDCRARRAPISSTARDFTRRPSSAGSRRRSCNARIARQKLCFEVRARIPLKKPLSDAFSGAVPGTHPAPCKRPQNRPRGGAAKLPNPAPRPNRPPGKKTHACPGRGGREASNEPRPLAG